jgi:hypothetical protein
LDRLEQVLPKSRGAAFLYVRTHAIGGEGNPANRPNGSRPREELASVTVWQTDVSDDQRNRLGEENPSGGGDVFRSVNGMPPRAQEPFGYVQCVNVIVDQKDTTAIHLCAPHC